MRRLVLAALAVLGSCWAASLAAQSKPWWVSQDASGDVVALCDNGGPTVATGLSPTGAGGAAVGPATIPTGRVVQQFTYDAYGAVLAAEQVVSDPNVVIPNLRVGHKGLFADRLDVGITTSGTDPPPLPSGGPLTLTLNEPARLVPYAWLINHARNRIYLPALGVWGQGDPSGTGQPVLASAGMHGTGPDALLGGFDRFDVKAHFGDGFGTHGYLSASPLMQSDALGLWPNPLDLVSSGVNVGVASVRGGLENMVGEYGRNMEDDVDWAMDWSRGDDEHSRGDNSWVDESFREGLISGAKRQALEEMWALIDPTGLVEEAIDAYVNEGVEPQMASAQMAKAAKSGGGVSRPRNYHLRGKFHPGSVAYGKPVLFNMQGYPDFSPHAKATVNFKTTGKRGIDARAADRLAGYGPQNPRPKGFTWHHHESGKAMQLVDSRLHRIVGHTGSIGRRR